MTQATILAVIQQAGYFTEQDQIGTEPCKYRASKGLASTPWRDTLLDVAADVLALTRNRDQGQAFPNGRWT